MSSSHSGRTAKQQLPVPSQVEEQIQNGARRADKTYGYDEAHDPGKPAQIWFQEDDHGLILFVVFYTQACRWSRCLGCNLPSRMSVTHVAYRDLMRQVDTLFAMPEVMSRLGEIRKLIVSNNGSMLDQATFSSTALMYLLAKVNLHLPAIRVLNLETRPEYVDLAELEFLSRVLAEGETETRLELSIGFEAFDDHVRNDIFDKGLDLLVFEELVARIAPYGYHLKCYFMQKPVPEMSDAEAVADIQAGIAYLGDIARRYQVPINVHLNPTYAAKGTRLAEAFDRGLFRPPFLADVARAAQSASSEPVTVFIGLNDEGLAVAGGSFIRPGEEWLLEELERFNRTQDYSLLTAICT